MTPPTRAQGLCAICFEQWHGSAHNKVSRLRYLHTPALHASVVPYQLAAQLTSSSCLQLAAVLLEVAPVIVAQEGGVRQLYDISLEGLVHLAAALSSLISAALDQGTPADAPALTPLVCASAGYVSHLHVPGPHGLVPAGGDTAAAGGSCPQLDD